MELPRQFYYKKNRLQQVKGFCYTVQTGSMNKAADKMGLTPATVTLQIQSLERDLGINLFIRNAKKIKLTSEGEMFYNRAIFHLQGIEDLFKNFAKIVENKKSNVISIAGNVGISFILPEYIKKFEDAHTEVKFEIKNLVRSDAIKRMINDEIDISVYSMTPKLLPVELDFIPLIEYPPILLMHKDYPLAKKKKVTLRDIKKYKLLSLDPHFDEMAKGHGLETKIEFEMASHQILKRFVKKKIGIAVVSGVCIEDEGDKDFVGKNLSQYFPSLTYGIMIKKGKTPSSLLQEFIDLLLKKKFLKSGKYLI